MVAFCTSLQKAQMNKLMRLRYSGEKDLPMVNCYRERLFIQFRLPVYWKMFPLSRGCVSDGA